MTFKVGDRVELLADADYSQFDAPTIIRAGERGDVVWSECGHIDIKMDRYHPGLADYGNCIWLTPGDGIAVRRVVNCKRLVRTAMAASLAAVALVSLSFTGHIGSVLTAHNSEPFVWGASRLVSDVIEPSERLVVVSSHKYLRACDWSVMRHWYHNGTEIAKGAFNLPPIKVNAEFTQRRDVIETPAGLTPGNYVFKSELLAECEGTKYKYEAIEQNFTVVEHRT